MSTYKYKKATITILIIALAIFITPSFAKTEKINIVYIMTDDHSYQTYSAYNGKLKDIVKTPNLDKIANEGVLFNKCYVTNSICGPSRATVLTGKHSHMNRHFSNDNKFDNTQQTFPKILQKNGYKTAIVGKWHLNCEPTGFDYWEVFPSFGEYFNPKFLQMDGTTLQRKGYSANIIVDKSIEWIDSVKENPFMIMVHFKGTHAPWAPDFENTNLYDKTEFPIPENFFDDYQSRGLPAEISQMRVDKHIGSRLINSPKGATPEESKKWRELNEEKLKNFREKTDDDKLESYKFYKRYMQDYCGVLKSVDDTVGQLLKYLEENGLDENTMIVYTSDQGFFMGEHGWFDKRFMYEQTARTPLAIKCKGHIKEGIKSDALVQNLDFAQTILDFAGCQIPEDMQGVSLRKILETGETPADWRKSLYYRYYEWPGAHNVMRHDGIITEDDKLLDFFPISHKEYYNLNDDPNENINAVNIDKYQKRIAYLEKELDNLRDYYNAPPLDGSAFQQKRFQEALKELKLQQQ